MNLKHPISEYMRERAHSGESLLRSLLIAFQNAIQAKRYDAAKHVEYAIHALRREEIDDFVCELEQYEKRIAASSLEPSP
jgi:hypothetical protein